ncbi:MULTISPECIES: LLM class flavin-dependent oxidoreductase [unclassified Duganella]|uniref:LLM class flavin-dependent oxidoreductase n=1 Tax=unclassified Duganella TaxID=2636909 RepID=UPI0008812FAA|nr:MULTISPECIES: LLM class flavin-dependent oxidoreductase [unclassified Duganella]SDF42909.1 alkanesulfonate monooxygenase [Duganella sp. OV458]SDI83640.1 alkanesulfonate monooxygenase [Duganella sp. OV510]
MSGKTGVKILWYLTAPDGQVPWEADGRWQTGYGHLQQLASTIDKLGYYGALLATGADEVNVLAASVLSVTQRMKFVAAVYPGLIAPAKLAQIAQTINRFSGNRLIYNVVNGNDKVLPSQGFHLPHDERYDYSLEYWDAFKRLYSGSGAGYDGKYIQIAPRPADAGGGSQRGAAAPSYAPIPLWGAGTSGPGVAHSVQTLDVYLSFANTPARLGEKFRRVGAEAAKLGRQLEYGTRLQIIVRETEEEAWEYAEYLVSRTSVEYARQSIERQLPPGEHFDTYVSPDPQVNRNLEQIRAGRLPKARDYEIYPNIWTGPALHGFNVLGPAQGTTLVGSAENVAARIREFQAHGVGTFILSGWPLIEEAYRVADLLFPLLDLDHGFDVPLLSPGRRPAAQAPLAAAA